MTENAPTNTELGVVTNVLKLMADKTRLPTLSLPRGEEMGVTVIASAPDRPVPAISQYPVKLRMANMVQARKEGTFSFYPQPNEYLTNLVVNAPHFAEHTLYSNLSRHRAQ